MPSHILFSQHGLTDTNCTMLALAQRLAPQMHIVAPDLGYLRTLLHIEPLLQTIEAAAEEAFYAYPNCPARIVATSLGGVLWVELLSRHRQWWPRIESIVLLGAPIGGADYARLVDPLGLGIGIAKHLGQNRRPLAEAIAATIPTLVIASETQDGRDGTVPITATRINHAYFVCLSGVTHPQLRYHPKVVETIRAFWAEPRSPLPAPEETPLTRLLTQVRQLPGITDTSTEHFPLAKVVYTLSDGSTLRCWKNLLGIDHVYVANAQGQCEYAGFCGWIHSDSLHAAIARLKQSGL
ncbi:MAG: hypothetical protein Q6K80_06530 [Thermostichus sp. DG_1_6_bins_120]